MHDSIDFFKIRVKVISSLLMLLAIFYSVYFAILMVKSSNRLKANLVIMNRTPTSLIELNKQADVLQKITSNIDSHTLGDIKNALTETANLAELVGVEFQAQYNSWVIVKGQINKDTDNFIQLKQKLDQVQNFQDIEIVRLKKLLDESTKPSFLSISFNIFASFAVGVLSSILASHVYSRWLQKKLGYTSEGPPGGGSS
jgi:ABC-type antimicrobial peptide transport system permease subunit